MGERKKKIPELPADRFMAKHREELDESEEAISMKLLTAADPQMNSLASFLTPNPQHEAWLRAQASPGHRLMRELRQYWLVRLLRAAIKENSPEAYRELLEGWLIRLGVEPPEGVLRPPRRPRGAPHKESTEHVFRIWVQTGKPEWSALAYSLYRTEYTAADAKQRKRLRDRCRRAVVRYMAMYSDTKAGN